VNAVIQAENTAARR